MRFVWVLVVAMGCPAFVCAAGAGTKLAPPVWSALPFAALLLGIAVLPLVVGHWWHANRSKGIVTAGLALPVAVFLLSQPGGTGALLHGLEEYVSFIALLTALYVIAGGIVVAGDLPAHPLTNVLFLACGAVLANAIGTTGASMVLIHPLLRTNSERKHTKHLPVFFIFIVSNCAGLLTPFGDPPLFLGFLRGVDFFWTFQLWPQWLIVNGILLALFYLIDKRAYNRESPADIKIDEERVHPLRVRGLIYNAPLMIGAILAVLAKKFGLAFPSTELILLLLAGASWVITPRSMRHANRFSWDPILEVAILFIGIFITMVPALALLDRYGESMGVTEPWQFFWLTGVLSSGLDNAPTYLTMGELGVAVRHVDGFPGLAEQAPLLLAAVSCGAVFMGANSYIGNGPNFMVKAIAEKNGYAMPSFFGYVFYAALILYPIYFLITLLFFI